MFCFEHSYTRIDSVDSSSLLLLLFCGLLDMTTAISHPISLTSYDTLDAFDQWEPNILSIINNNNQKLVQFQSCIHISLELWKLQ